MSLMKVDREIIHNIRFQQAISKFQRNGGKFGVAYAMLCAAYGRGSEGHPPAADEAEAAMPEASPQVAAAGQLRSVDETGKALPSAAAERTGEGQSHGADKAKASLPSPASSRFKPGHSKRGAATIAAVQDTMSKASLFDTIKLPDGRPLREVRWSECPRLSKRYRFMSRVLMAVHDHATPAEDTTLDNVVNEERLQELVDAVETFNDIS